MKYDIFISYSSQDRQQVSAYAELLRNHGFSVWMDQTGILHGHEFPEEITKAIQECGILVFFSSRFSNESKWVRREIVYADSQNKTILPLWIEKCEYNPSLQLLLIGIEHIDATELKQSEVQKKLLSAVQKELGRKGSPDTCPIIKESCPVGKKGFEVLPSVQERIYIAKDRMAFKYRVRCEGFVFSSLCEFIWMLLIGIPLIWFDVLAHPMSLFVCAIIAFFLAIYTTHMSTNSFFVPGWYNRHLTTYGALILATNFFINVLCLSISASFTIGWLAALAFGAVALVGLVAMILIFRLKRFGYYLLWINVVLFSFASWPLWTDSTRLFGIFGLAILLSLFVLILTSTMKLRYNGTSTWSVLFGKGADYSEQEVSKIESFLLKIWSRFY